LKKLKFIYFTGCPNAQKMKETLEDLDYQLDEIEQTSLQSGDQYKNYSSPTVIKDERIIFGGKAEGGGCSLNMPTKDKLKELLS
jgi:glutaredoxin